METELKQKGVFGRYNATCRGTRDVSSCIAANILANLDFGRESTLFLRDCRFFRYENDHFTKTGSGQTIGKVEKRSCSAGVLPFLYDGLFRNGTGPNVLEHMFPIEVLRIEPGEKKRLGGGLPFCSKLPFRLSRACLDKSPGFIDLPGTHKLTTSACLVFC